MVCHLLSVVGIVAYTLSGLNSNFKELEATIRARDTPMTFEELHDKHLDHKTFLKQEEGNKIESPITTQFNPKAKNKKNIW